MKRCRDILLRSFIAKVAKEIKQPESKLRKYGPYAAGAAAVPALAYLGAKLAPGSRAAERAVRLSMSIAKRKKDIDRVRKIFTKILR